MAREARRGQGLWRSATFSAMRTLVALVLVLLAGLRPAAATTSAPDVWAELRKPGAIVLIRHALAPGVGDPPGMRIGDCATQRNLSDEGRAQARRLGEQFREQGVRVGQVISSQWCRTRETARLAFGNAVRDEPAFNSFFGKDGAAREAQTARARELLARWKGPDTLVVVTHQVNITALTGLGAASGEAVVLARDAQGGWKVQGSFTP